MNRFGAIKKTVDLSPFVAIMGELLFGALFFFALSAHRSPPTKLTEFLDKTQGPETPVKERHHE